MHLINRPDNHPPGPDAQSLYMEITCSGHATVFTTVHHRPDTAFEQERSQAKFLEFRSHSCPSGRLISLELFDSRPLNLHLLDLVFVVYITCCSFCVLSYFQVLIEI
jgi:hypothetical protein